MFKKTVSTVTKGMLKNQEKRMKKELNEGRLFQRSKKKRRRGKDSGDGKKGGIYGDRVTMRELEMRAIGRINRLAAVNKDEERERKKALRDQSTVGFLLDF